MATVKRANAALIARANSIINDMALLETDLYKAGDQELAAVVKRARREFIIPSGPYTGAIGTQGVNAGAIRR